MRNLISKLISKPFIKQLIKFAFVGAIGTIVNLTILYVLTEFLLVYYIISEIFDKKQCVILISLLILSIIIGN